MMRQLLGWSPYSSNTLLPARPRQDAVSLELLPLALAGSIRQSGILSLGGDYGWLRDKRNIAILTEAEAAHDGQKRATGNRARLIHEIWCMHQRHNNRAVKNFLTKTKRDPFLAAFLIGAHDNFENFRALAEKKGITFDAEASYDKICKIWGIKKDFAYIREYMNFHTDNPALHGQKRIDDQKRKAYDEYGNFILDPLFQASRKIDKDCHLHFDAEECLAGHMSPSVAAKRYEQAIMKSFPLHYPVATIGDWLSYRRKLRILQRTAEGKLNLHNDAAYNDFSDYATAMTRKTASSLELGWRALRTNVGLFGHNLATSFML